MNITVGDAQNGKRKIEDPGNPKVCPHVKAFIKHYMGKVAAGLMVIVLFCQLIPAIIDFGSENTKQNNDRRGRR